MRYTCFSISQLPNSESYFRLPGDQVSCMYNIFLDGILNVYIDEPGVYMILESTIGVITGNFTSIKSNTPVTIEITKTNVTVTAITIEKSNLVSIVIIVGSVLSFLIVCFAIWYKYRQKPVQEIRRNPMLFGL